MGDGARPSVAQTLRRRTGGVALVVMIGAVLIHLGVEGALRDAVMGIGALAGVIAIATTRREVPEPRQIQESIDKGETRHA